MPVNLKIQQRRICASVALANLRYINVLNNNNYYYYYNEVARNSRFELMQRRTIGIFAKSVRVQARRQEMKEV